MRQRTLLFCAALLFFAFLPVSAAAADPAELEAAGVSEGQFHLRVLGEAGSSYRVEVSSNLVDWVELTTVSAPSDLFEVSDEALAGFQEKFYRASRIVISAGGLKAGETRIFSGDGTALLVDVFSPAGWKFTVNGSETGNEETGLIVSAPGNPAQAFYSAPVVTAPREVEVCAEDRADPTKRYCVTLTIVPLAGTLVVRPAAVTLGVGGEQQFVASVEVPGVGLVPLNRSFWKVNGEFGGTGEAGSIGVHGEYQAPPRLPGTLPTAIEVGFSMDIESAVLATATVTLAALEVEPEKLVFTEAGQQGQLTATLLKSDGSVAVQGPGAVTFSSSEEAVATVDQGGAVTAAANAGEAFIKAVHNTLKVADYAVIEGRERARIFLLEVEPRTTDRLRISKPSSNQVKTVEEIEVTAPGAMFNLKPDIYFYRGAFSIFADSISAVGNESVRIEGDGEKTISYDPDVAVPQPTGLVATIDRRTGFTIIGDTPGTGLARFVYDDGYVQHSSTSRVTFTRLNLSATMTPSSSAAGGGAYITEWLNFRVEVENPRADSSFIGDTPIRVRRSDGGRFLIATRLNHKPEGLTVLPRPMQVDETADARLMIPGGEFNGEDPEFGKVEFSISPRDTGEMEFLISVANDPGVPPIEIPVTIRQPRLRIRTSPEPEFVRGLPGYGAVAGSKVVRHSFVDLEQIEGPSLGTFSQVPNMFFPLRELEPLVWTIERPDGSLEMVTDYSSIANDIRFSRNFHQMGKYRVTLGFEGRPEVSTEPLEIQVIGPGQGGEFAEVAEGPKVEVFDEGVPVPAANQVAGLQITTPLVATPWLDGTPVTISARTYNGNGQPGIIGKRIRVINRPAGGPVEETISYKVAGFWAAYIAGPTSFTPFDVRRIYPAYPDANGIVTVQFTPENNTPGDTAKDLVMALIPTFFTLSSEQFDPEIALPEQVKETVNGQVVRDEFVPLGVVNYQSGLDKGLLNQAIIFGGAGAVVTPQFLPVATGRLRRAVAEGELPGGSDLVRFRMSGRDGFVASLEEGLPTIEFGGRAEVVSVEREGNEVVFTARTLPEAFEGDSGLYGATVLPVRLGNAARINVGAAFTGFRVETNTVDFNLPLNAAYSFRAYTPFGSRWERHEDGVLPIRITTPTFNAPGRPMELDLRPSIHACWDENKNGIAEPDEDLNGDGLFTDADAADATAYRGAFADQPLIGFSRQPHAGTGELQVRELHKRMFGGNAAFYLYGNITDERWLNRRTMLLSEKGRADGIPDFASPEAGAEVLLVRGEGGNLADYFNFTAYNLVAEVAENIPDRDLEFETVGANITSAYSTYGSFNSALTVQQAADSAAAQPVSVYVDHEALPSDFHEEVPNVLQNFVPLTYYAGVLDQYYQRGLSGGGFGNVTEPYRLGQDGRVHGFDSRKPGGGPTQQERRHFGIDLDGALYDAISFNALVERPAWSYLPGIDLQYQAYVAAATNRLDEEPNSAALRSIPVVQKVLGPRTNLTAQGLVRGVGGTSGGYADFTRHSPGSFMIESKTPGADLPGLHAGYLIEGRPEQVVDPRSGVSEDDLRDVIVKRNPVTHEIVQEVRALGLKQPRPVHGFAFNEDYKAPIRTGVKITSEYAVRTDPPGISPANPETWKFRASVALREVPDPSSEESLLLVTTQSDGHEKLLKLVVDTAVDVAVDVTTGAVLGALTRGSYIACGGSASDAVKSAFINFSIGLTDADVIPGGRDFKAPLTFLNKVANSDPSFSDLKPVVDIPMPGVKLPGLKKLLASTPALQEFSLKERLRTPDYKIYNVPGHAIVPFCSILTAPVGTLKNAIKNTYSAELFNGLGSASAFAMKTVTITLPRDAQVENGLYSATFMVSREVEVQPKEPDSVRLDDLPYESVFGAYPFADEVSDTEFHRILRESAEEAASRQARADAVAILDYLATKSVMRVPRTTMFQPYRLQVRTVPSIAVAITPRQRLNSSQSFGDFEIAPDATIIPVSSAAVAVVSRSNENAGARATISSPGYEMVFMGAVIRNPPRF